METHLRILDSALDARLPLLDADHEGAFRLFNGFYEGWLELVVDLYGRTAVIFNYADPPDLMVREIPLIVNWLISRMSWLNTVLLKQRNSADLTARLGNIIFGSEADSQVVENGVRYGINLCLHQDASFYLDTRNVRKWLKTNMAGKRVLNTFAYTGSLGTAALAGGAASVLQTDRSCAFLDSAKQSARLNGFHTDPDDYLVGDFFRITSQLRHQNKMFDCVIIDPPFFSTSPHGRVDLIAQCTRLINKVRPLVKDCGVLVAVNNAVFLSGADYYSSLQELSSDGYMEILESIPIPEDVTGFPHTIKITPPVDPAPFNHPTKIAILGVRRK